ncbi:alpha/beta fold hydrolase [Actinophytocola oryzae]|uniref:Prolyl oligopeptidase family protein n=1 Tax=Actinophytocola oryzae TaxID=502181 RepID=A0A4R7W038_9PSEU|nr:prolyl oligopeptidase family serine peptidase [Actinophytocola oryzae]TDV55298.1 prolyl oligopeptidase family protein [Actinophytocola oryzae]
MTISGVAAGVPFTALPPANGEAGQLVVTWHMLDAPRTDAAFAAALPMTGVPAWRVHLGLPMCGARMVDGSMDAVVALTSGDPLRDLVDGLTRQALEEFPAALTALRATLPVTDGPIGILGGSLGGLVALRVLTSGTPVAAAALVNPLVRARTYFEVIGREQPTAAREPADELDFVARAAELAMPLLVVSGEHDLPPFRADARALADAAPNAELRTVPGLGHPLAEEPGLERAPQRPTARVVDEALTEWFTRHLA